MEYDAPLCRACTEIAYAMHTAGAHPRRAGLAKAIISALFSIAAYGFGLFAYMIVLIATNTLTMQNFSIPFPIYLIASLFAVAFSAVAFVFFVTALLFGIASIRRFAKTPRGVPRPIATLVLGIFGLYFSAMAALYVLITLGFLLCLVGLLLLSLLAL